MKILLLGLLFCSPISLAVPLLCWLPLNRAKLLLCLCPVSLLLFGYGWDQGNAKVMYAGALVNGITMPITVCSLLLRWRMKRCMRHQFDEPIGRQSGRTESAPEIYGHLWSGYLFNYPDGGSVHYDRHGDLIAFGCDGKKLRKFR